MVLDLVLKVVRRLHFQSIAQTDYGKSETDEICVNIKFNKSRNFISEKNELISDCFRVRRDCLC